MKPYREKGPGAAMSALKKTVTTLLPAVILSAACCWNDFSTDIGEYGGEDWSFVIVGDSSSGGGIYSNLASWMTQIRPMPVFVVHLGDMISFPGNEFEWEYFMRLSVPLMRAMSFYSTPGNHDVDDEHSQDIYRNHFTLPGNELYYSFSCDDYHFIVLDSEIPGQSGSIADPQKSWLEAELASVDPLHRIVVFLHKPVFSDSGNSVGNAAELHSILQAHNVVLVAAGHEHRFYRTLQDGICYLISGGGGSPLHNNHDGDYHHFTKVSVFPAKINIKTIGVFGETIENFDLAL